MIQVEALDEPPPPDPRIGFRCQERHPDLGPCNRHHDHVKTDEWHHSVTDYDPLTGHIQHWRWKTT